MGFTYYWWLPKDRPDQIWVHELHVSVSAGFSHWLITFVGEEFFHLLQGDESGRELNSLQSWELTFCTVWEYHIVS